MEERLARWRLFSAEFDAHVGNAKGRLPDRPPDRSGSQVHRGNLPLLKDSLAKLGRDAIYWHYPHYSPQGGTPSGAIREGDMKLIEFFEDDHVELYNLKDDLSETTDLATENPELAERLHEKLKAWRTEVDAKLP